MRLSDKQIADIKEYFTRSSKIKISSIIHKLSTDGLNLIDTIEALQRENEQLKAKLDEWKYEAKCHMDEVAARDKEIERLKAQVDTLSATVNIDACIEMHEAILEIDKAIGGKEDV